MISLRDYVRSVLFFGRAFASAVKSGATFGVFGGHDFTNSERPEESDHYSWTSNEDHKLTAQIHC